MSEAATILLQIAAILLAAKVGGEIAGRLKQPAVLGEVLVGVLIGPSVFGIIGSFEAVGEFGSDLAQGTAPSERVFEEVQNLHVIEVLALLGVLVLLFEVGLESNIHQLRRVGASAVLVGTFGVLFSLVLGAATSYAIATQIGWVITDAARDSPYLLHIFVGATLTATSVGITARVLGELKTIRSAEGQIILGAAVFDDVLGLIVLAIVTALATAGALSVVAIGRIFALALGFFFAAVLLGTWLAPKLIRLVHRAFTGANVHLAFGFLFMLVLSYLAGIVGLNPIVGAFAAGLALSGSEHRHVIFDDLKPVGSLFIGFFFVVLGTKINLREIGGETGLVVVAAALLLTAIGIVAKLMAGWGVIRIKASRYVVGIGMVPRGEVGLIFAVYGLTAALIENWQYTTLIVVVLLTTVVTPSWLKAVAGRFGPDMAGAPAPTPVGEALRP